MDTEDLLRKRLGEGRFRQIERAIKSQKLLDTAPRAAQYQGFQINSGAIIRSVGDGVRSVTPISNGLVAPGDGVRIVGWSANWKPRVEAPVEEEIKEEEYYPFKVLFSVKEPDPNDKTKEVLAFYLGGDRRAPKRLFKIGVNEVIAFAALHNYGKKFKATLEIVKNGKSKLLNITEKSSKEFTDEGISVHLLTFVQQGYIGDSKYNSIIQHAGFSQTFSSTGSHCDSTVTGTVKMEPAFKSPFAASGFSRQVRTGDGEKNEYCRLFQENSILQLQFSTVNLFIDSLNKEKINVCNASSVTATNWTLGTDIIATADFSHSGSLGGGLIQGRFEVTSDYRFVGNSGSLAGLTRGVSSESYSLKCPVFCGLKYYIEQDITIKLDANYGNYLQGTPESLDITRPIYSNNFLLKKYNEPSFSLPLFQQWKGLFLASDTDIALTETSTNVELSLSDIRSRIIIIQSDFNQYRKTYNLLDGYIKSFIGTSVVVNQNNLTGKGVISNIQYSIQQESFGLFSFVDDFKINVSLSIVEKNYPSLTSQEGLVYSVNGSIQDLIIIGKNENYFTGGNKSLVFMSSDLEVNFLNFNPYYLKVISPYSLFAQFPDDLPIRSYYLRWLGAFLLNSSFIEKSIYRPNFLTSGAYNLSDYKSFDDIKKKDVKKYAEKWSIGEDGKIVQEKSESGICLSLNSPNCTIHAVSYCPKPNP